MILPVFQRVMLFIFTLIVMQVILFCLAIDGPPGLHIAIVNHEMDWESNDCPVSPGCDFTKLSCRYVNHLRNDTIIKEYYNTPESAVHAVEVGGAWGALYFTENFTDALVARMALGTEADNETLEQSDVHVWLDMSNQQIGLMLNKYLQVAYQNFSQELRSDCYNARLEGLIQISTLDKQYTIITPEGKTRLIYHNTG